MALFPQDDADADLLLRHADRRGAEAAARRVLDATVQAYTLEGMQFTLTGSIGMAMYPDDGASFDSLLRNAESAVLAAKQAGRGLQEQRRRGAVLCAQCRRAHGHIARVRRAQQV